MSKLLIPNTCQVPNVLLDEIMPTLSGSSLKVLLAIVRKTYGFQKESDKISFRTLRVLTGLSRDSVNHGIKGLGALLTIIPGLKGVPTLEGVNEYALNLNVKTGELVRKSDRSENRTSQEIGKEQVRKSDSSKPNSSKPTSASKKSSQRSPTDKDPRVKEFIGWFASGYAERLKQPYHVKVGKDGNLVKGLLRTFDLQELQRRAVRLWESQDEFILKTDRGIGILANQVNKLSGATLRAVTPRGVQEIPAP